MPVAEVGTGAPRVVERAPSQADPTPPKESYDDDCEPAMYPQAPAADRAAFEDPSGKLGYRDAAGKVAIAPRFFQTYEFFEDGIAGVVDEEGPAFIDRQGKVLARAYLFDNGPDYFVGDRARIVEDGKIGFIDRKGTIVVKPGYDHATPFCHGRAGVCLGCKSVPDGEHSRIEGGRWGYIDAFGRVVVPIELDDAPPFTEEVVEVTKSGAPLHIDRQGRKVSSP
jgi:hypothetical protein